MGFKSRSAFGLAGRFETAIKGTMQSPAGASLQAKHLEWARLVPNTYIINRIEMASLQEKLHSVGYFHLSHR